MKAMSLVSKAALVMVALATVLLSVASPEAQDSRGAQQKPIVGFWTVKFIAKGNTAASTGLPQDKVPPDGAVIDDGNQQFHSDGTEIHNSGT